MTTDICRSISEATREVTRELLDMAGAIPGQVFVLGLSTSELVGEDIGSSGNMDLAAAVIDPLREVLSDEGIYLAVQCCEHLNRALVVEEDLMARSNLVEVAVLPRCVAGGAGAAYAYEVFADPRVVAGVSADVGMDIGDTFIGMHLKPVVVPVRLGRDAVGSARLTLARTRPPLIGGARAEYPADPGKMRGRSSRLC